MHDTAYDIGRLFLECYSNTGQLIVELGSYNVNGSLRDFCPIGVTYLGLDFCQGPSVDIYVEAGHPLPLRDSLADIVLTSSAFEHDQFFWETFLELVRVLKPGGILYLNAPSNGPFHRYPVDCWRFYPDSGRALEAYARKNGHTLMLVESFTADRRNDTWNDFVAVFKKGEEDREFTFISDLVPCRNVIRAGSRDVLLRASEETEDMQIIANLRQQNVELSDLTVKLTEQVLALEEAMRESLQRVELQSTQYEQAKEQIATLSEQLAATCGDHDRLARQPAEQSFAEDQSQSRDLG